VAAGREGPQPRDSRESNSLPPSWKIHDVVSIDHLEPHTFDPYGRHLPAIQPVTTEDHPIKKILAQRITAGKHWYLVQFEGLGQEFDQSANGFQNS
jgi:hypothetical protein